MRNCGNPHEKFPREDLLKHLMSIEYFQHLTQQINNRLDIIASSGYSFSP